MLEGMTDNLDKTLGDLMIKVGDAKIIEVQRNTTTQTGESLSAASGPALERLETVAERLETVAEKLGGSSLAIKTPH